MANGETIPIFGDNEFHAYTDSRLRRETAGFKLKINAKQVGPVAIAEGIPVYIDAEGEQTQVGVLIGTLPKNLDAYDFASLMFEMTLPDEAGTLISLPGMVSWIKKGTHQQTGEDEFCMLTTDVVVITLNEIQVGLHYVAKTGEVFSFMNSDGSLDYFLSRGFVVPYEHEDSGSDDGGDGGLGPKV